MQYKGIVYGGAAFVQQRYRVNVRRCCKENGIHEGDRVRVWIEVVDDTNI